MKKLIKKAEELERKILSNWKDAYKTDPFIGKMLCESMDIGVNLVRAANGNISQTVEFLKAALRECAVTEYRLKFLHAQKLIACDNLIGKCRKLKRMIFAKLKRYTKMCKTSNAFFDDFHERIYDAVKRQLDDFDAYSLLAMGAPNDEFESEAKNITKQIKPNMSADHIAAVMADEMRFAFGDNEFTKEKFLHHAENVHGELNKTISELSKYGDLIVLYEVAFDKFGSKYSYLYDGDEFIKIGDKVIVPVGEKLTKTLAEVTSIETVFHKHGTPPLFDFMLKSIIRKVDEYEYEDYISSPDDWEW